MKTAIATSLLAATLVACGGDTLSTANRTEDGFGGSGGAAGPFGTSGGAGTQGGGGSDTGGGGVAGEAGGSAGAGNEAPGGSAGENGFAGGPQVEAALFVQRPGRPRSLALDGNELRWVLAPDTGAFEGPVESIDVTGGEVRTTFPATPPVASFSSPAGAPFLYASGSFGVGGLRRVPKTGGPIEIVLEDPEPSFDLAVIGEIAFRIRGGEHAETWIERIDLATNARTRVSQSAELDAYIGDFVTDGSALFWTTQAYSLQSGLYRGPLDGSTQQQIASGEDDAIGLAGEEIVRIRRGWQTGGASYLVDAIPKAGGEPRALFASDLGSLAHPTLVGEYVYFVGLGTIGEPHKLVRAPLEGGQLSVVVAALCQPDSFTPSLVASTTTLYVACTTEGTIRAVTPPD